MPTQFRIDDFDSELASRMQPREWQRTLTLRNHPDFLRGLAQYDTLMPAYFSDNVILNKVVTEAWRFEMLVYTLHLHDTRDAANPRSGLTVSHLQRVCAAQQCASPGRVLAIVGIMQLGGYLRRRRSEMDSRVVLLEPTDKLITIVEGWNHRIFQIIDAIMPDGQLAQSHLDHERFGWEMRRGGARSLLAGWHLLAPFPEVVHFVSKDGGWMLLLSCVAATMRQGGGREIVPVSLELQAFGKRFGVSRSHLRRLLEAAHAAGLLDAPPRNGTYILLAAKLVAAFLACMACELGNYRAWALEARHVLENSRD